MVRISLGNATAATALVFVVALSACGAEGSKLLLKRHFRAFLHRDRPEVQLGRTLLTAHVDGRFYVATTYFWEKGKQSFVRGIRLSDGNVMEEEKLADRLTRAWRLGNGLWVTERRDKGGSKGHCFSRLPKRVFRQQLA